MRTRPRLVGAGVLTGLLAVCLAAVVGCAPSSTPPPSGRLTSIRYTTYQDVSTVTLDQDGRAHVTLSHDARGPSWEHLGTQFLEGYADASVLADLAEIITRQGLSHWDGYVACALAYTTTSWTLTATYADQALTFTGASSGDPGMCDSARLTAKREQFDTAVGPLFQYIDQLTRALPGYDSLIQGPGIT